MSPAAVYVHFASKEALLYELSLVGHQAALEIVVAAADAAPGDPAGAAAQAVVSDFAAWHARHRRTARVVQYELAALTPAHRDGDRRAAPGRSRPGCATCSSPASRAGAFVVPDVPRHRAGPAVARRRRGPVVPAGRRRAPPTTSAALYADLALRMVTAR